MPLRAARRWTPFRPLVGTILRPTERLANMITSDDRALSRIDPELRAARMARALRSLASDLVDERRKVAALRRELTEARSQLAALERLRDSATATAADRDEAARSPCS